ncbi:MAG TPA: leucine-rich repeat protein, partial [Bacillus bacterium]|nr:leucine-rich repeat protein [Bacillus sp. (in: firmicutes)]
MVRRSISILLTIILLFNLPPFAVFAEDTQGEGSFQFDPSTGTITEYMAKEVGEDVVIPETIQGVKVKKIGERAFQKKWINSVIIPNGVTDIGDFAFINNRLKAVDIPSSVTKIGAYAFTSNKLEDITIPDGITTIETEAFARNPLKRVMIPNTVTKIGWSAFVDCRLTEITIPNSVTYIDETAFYNNQLTSIDIPASVTRIDHASFGKNPIKNIIIHNNIPELYYTAFKENSVQYISIPGDVDNSNFLDSFINLFPSAIIISDENSPAHTLAVNTGRDVQLIGKTAIFDLKGGEGNFSTHTVRPGNPLVKPEAIPTKQNAVFKNWRINSDSVYDFRNVTENITVFAEWEDIIPDTATIQINYLDVDTNHVLDSETVTKELGIHTINAKEIDGYTLEDTPGKAVTLTKKDETVTVEFKYKRNQYEFDRSTGTIINYIGTDENVIIPETINGVSVVKIGNSAFKEKQLKSVIIPNSVTIIGNEAFSGNELKEVHIPNNVASIGDKAFEYNHLKNITISDSVASIGNYAFMANGLTEITLPASLTKLNMGVFVRNDIKNIIIPGNITSIENYVFFGNPLEFISIPRTTTYIHKSFDTIPSGTIIIAEENSPGHAWSMEMGQPIQLVGKTITYELNGGQGTFPSHTVGFGNPLVKPEGTPTKDNANFWYWRINLNSDSNYDFRFVTEDITVYAEWVEILPDSATIYVSHKDIDTNEELEVETLMKELGTHTIYSKEFVGYILADDASKEVTLSAKDEEVIVEFKYKGEPFEFDESTGTITGYTGTELNVVIPDMIKGVSVVNIGDEVFKNKQIQSVVLPNTIESIGDYAFYGNNLQTVILPNNLISIGDNGFGENLLKSIIIPNSVTNIGHFAFYDNKLADVHIPDGITTIGAGAFQKNNLETVIIPDGITTIENVTFAENQLRSVVIPQSVTNIKGQAFAHNQLQSVAIPESVTGIGREAFANNQLKNIIIPNGVYSIEMNAFNDNPLEYISISRHTSEIENAYATISSTAIVITEQNSLAHIWAKDKGMAIQLVGKTATYNLDGGDGYFPSHTVKLGEPLVKPEDIPSKNRAIFKNWIISQGSIYDFRDVTEDVTISADWEEIIPDTGTIIVNYIDMETTTVIETETLKKELGTHTVNAKEIIGYTLAGVASMEVILPTKDETVTVVFTYKKNPTVESVNPLANIEVSYGTDYSSLSLPSTVQVTLSDQTSRNLNVTWDNGSPAYDGNNAGEYIFTGTLAEDIANPQGLKAQLKVIVNPKPIEVISVEALTDITVEYGTAYSLLPLPSTAKVTLSNQTSRNLNVTWDNGSPAYDGNTAGEYIFPGTLAEDIANPRNVNVQVKVVVNPAPVVPDTAIIQVNHLDIDTNHVLDSESMTKELGTYIVNSKNIPGYTLVDASSKQVTLTTKNQKMIVDFKYRQNFVTPDTAIIIINHIDMETKTVLEAETLTKELGAYTVHSREIAGYTLADAASKEVTLSTKDEEVTVEFKYKKNPSVESVDSLADIEVSYGTERPSLPLPSTVQVMLSDQTSRSLGVTWDNGTPTYDGNTAGEYTFTGTLARDVENPQNLTAEVKVVVQPKPAEPPVVSSVEPLVNIEVSYGTERSSLPLLSTVQVMLSDQTSRSLGVTWDNGTPTYDGNTAGEYTFTGTLARDVENPQNLTAKVKVVVKPKPTDPSNPEEPEAPTWPNGSALTVSDIAQTSVKLSWPSAVDNVGVTGYRIYVDGMEYVTVADNVNEQVVTGLKADTSYTFAIKAFNEAGK